MPKHRNPKNSRSRRPREVTDGAILAAVQQCAMEDVENENFDTALVWAENAVEHLETKGEPFVLANALQLLSFVLSQLGRHHDAIERAQRSRAIFVDLGELHWVADCDSFIAFNLHKLGKSPESNAKLESARAIYLESGDPTAAAMLLAVGDLWGRGVEVGMKVSMASDPHS